MGVVMILCDGKKNEASKVWKDINKIQFKLEKHALVTFKERFG